MKKKSKSEKILNATLQIICSGIITLKKYIIKLDYGSKNDEIVYNHQIRNKFKKKFIEKISNFYNIEKDRILILNIKRGSTITEFTTLDNIQIKDDDLKTIFKNHYIDITEEALFEGCKISEDLFDPRGDNFGDGYEKYNFKRGGEKYDPPYEWHAYGLKVLNRYDNGNNDWIGCDNNINFA